MIRMTRGLGVTDELHSSVIVLLCLVSVLLFVVAVFVVRLILFIFL
jgi:hypothetical protein